MAASCKKCDPHEICEECPEWIFTLADLIMCMMGLFVLLWVLKPSPNPEDKQANEEMVQMLAGIREAFGHVPDPSSTDPVDIEILYRKIRDMKPTPGPKEAGNSAMEPDGAEGTDPEVTSIREGIKAAVGGRLLFEAGEMTLSPRATHDLDAIADQIRGHRQIVFVKGHTSLDDFKDDPPAEKLMDLSIRRAQAVADYLTSKNVTPDSLRVQGCSIFEPVVQRRYTPDAQVNNRRVEVEVTDTPITSRQDSYKKLKNEKSAPPPPAKPPAH